MVPELVELVRPPRPRLRGRDFSRTSYHAPTTVRRLTRAYNEPPPRSWWRRWRWLAWALAVVGLGVWVSVSPFFELKNIIINGAPTAESSARLRALVEATLDSRRLGIAPQRNLVFLSTERLAGVISSEIANTEVVFDRHWPNVLRINLPPHVYVATWQAGSRTFLLDQQGKLAQVFDSSPPGLALTPVREVGSSARTLGDQVAQASLVAFLQNFSASWNDRLPGVALSYVEVEQQHLPSVRAVTGGGWYVLLSVAGELEPQLAALGRLFEEKLRGGAAKLEYIDVRFGSKLYYKLR